MAVTSGRKPRCVGAIATYLNAGLWGSRFIGDCEVSTNGERVWLKGRRVPAWVSLMRVICFVAFIPVGFYAGWILGETLIGHWGYPPDYYLASALLTFLLVVLGMWGAGIWTDSMSSYEVVSWPASKGSEYRAEHRSKGDTGRHGLDGPQHARQLQRPDSGQHPGRAGRQTASPRAQGA